MGERTDMSRVGAYFRKLPSRFDLEFIHDQPSDRSGKVQLLVREAERAA